MDFKLSEHFIYRVPKDKDILEREPFKTQMKIFSEFEKASETPALTSDERHQYEYYLKTFRDYNRLR